MAKYKRSILTLVIAAAGVAGVSAQGGVVSLDSCRSMALRNNKTIAIAQETVTGTGYDRKAAKAMYLPGIDFSAAYMYNQRKINLLAEDAKLPTEVAVIPKDALSFDTHHIFTGAVTLTQPVFMGGTIKALNDIARYAESAAVAGRNAVVQEVTFAVDQAYWLVVSLRAKQKLAESFVQLVDTLHRNVEAMYEEGVATRSDVLTVDVKLNEARIMETKVNDGLTLARMNLAQVCGLPADTQLTLSDEVDGVSSTPPAYTYNLEDVYANRQDLEAIRQGINVLKGRERMVMGTMLPKVGVFGAYEFSTPNLNNGFSKHVRGGFSVGAALTIPIWHWGGNYNHYRAAKSATRAQQLMLEDMEQKVELQVSQARFKFKEAFKTLDMTRSNMRSAQENLDNARIAFQEGVMTTNDVILAQTGWLQANSEKIDAEIGVRLCEVYLAKVLGTLGN